MIGKSRHRNPVQLERRSLTNFRSALDGKMKELTAEGVGTVKKHADPLTEEDEARLGTQE